MCKQYMGNLAFGKIVSVGTYYISYMTFNYCAPISKTFQNNNNKLFRNKNTLSTYYNTNNSKNDYEHRPYTNILNVHYYFIIA